MTTAQNTFAADDLLKTDSEVDAAIGEELSRQLFSPEMFEMAQKELTDIVGFWTKSEEHMEKTHELHLATGGLRSGSGLTEASRERMRLFEEAEMLEAIEESGELVTDPIVATKLHERWNKRVAQQKGFLPSDELDLIETDLTSPYMLPDEKSSQSEGRALSLSSDSKKTNIPVLDEPYPQTCHNSVQMS